jgi:hypothetical protein
VVDAGWQKTVAISLWLMFSAEPVVEDIRGTSPDSQAAQPIQILRPVLPSIERFGRTA